MPFPSLDASCRHPYKKPRILILEVRDPKEPYEKIRGWLIVEREEKETSDEIGVISSSIRLHYQRILPEKDRWDGGREVFSGAYSRRESAVSITSSSMAEGAIYLGISGWYGHRIGTYLMNEVVLWAKQWPEANLNRIRLSANDGHEENKNRRNRFYEQFGVTFDYYDHERKAGSSSPMFASNLIEVDTWKKNLSEYYVQKFIAVLLSKNRAAENDIQALRRTTESLRKKLHEAERTPLRWALKTLWGRYKFCILVMLVAVFVVYRVWEQVKAH